MRWCVLAVVAVAALGGAQVLAQPTNCGAFPPITLTNGIATGVDNGYSVLTGPMGSWGNFLTLWLDTYNPPGPVIGSSPSFVASCILFANCGGTEYQVALSCHPDIMTTYGPDATDPNGPPPPDPNLDITVGSFTAASGSEANSTFTVKSDDDFVDLSFALNQKVTANLVLPNTTSIVLKYTITNNNATALPIRMNRHFDGDLLFNLDATNDVVGVITVDPPVSGHREQFITEAGSIPTQTGAVVIRGDSSDGTLPRYTGALQGITPPGTGCLPYDFGTDYEEWDACGLPDCWVNYCAGAGYNVDGASDDLPAGDCHTITQFEVTVPASGSIILTYTITYGHRPLPPEFPAPRVIVEQTGIDPNGCCLFTYSVENRNPNNPAGDLFLHLQAGDGHVAGDFCAGLPLADADHGYNSVGYCKFPDANGRSVIKLTGSPLPTLQVGESANGDLALRANGATAMPILGSSEEVPPMGIVVHGAQDETDDNPQGADCAAGTFGPYQTNGGLWSQRNDWICFEPVPALAPFGKAALGVLIGAAGLLLVLRSRRPATV
jgi:hypothetical protein